MAKIAFGIVTAAALVSSCRGGATSVAARSSGGNLIVNGSFEEPRLTGGHEIFPGIPGWKVSVGPGIELQHGAAGSSSDGAQHAELDSTENTGIEQVVSTTVGSALSLSFMYSPRPGRPAATNGVEVRVDGKVIATLAEDGTPLADSRWSPHVFALTAARPTVTIEFRGTGASDGYGGYVDDVKVVRQE